MIKSNRFFSKTLAFSYVFFKAIIKRKIVISNNKILIIATGHMGNAILDINAIVALKNYYSALGKEVYILCSEALWKTFCLIEDMSDFIFLNVGYLYAGKSGTSFENVKGLVSKLNGYAFEKVIVTLTNDPVAHYMVAVIPSNEVWGIFDDVIRTHGSIRYYFERYYTNKVFVPMDLHELKRFGVLLKELGIRDYESKIHHINKLIEYTPLKRKYITISMDSMVSERRWPAERYTELINNLLAKFEYDVCCTGGGEANQVYNNIIDFVDDKSRVHNFANRTSITEWIELIRGAEFHISVDSGSIHVAASVGTQSFCLVGVWDGKRALPYDYDHEELDTVAPICVYRSDVEDIYKLPCYGCKVYGARFGRGNASCYSRSQSGYPCECLERIMPKDVIREIDRYIMRITSKK